MWLIKRIVDKGPKELYRYHVSGENASCEILTEFRWSVPDLLDDRYCVHSEADDSVRRIFAAARGAK